MANNLKRDDSRVIRSPSARDGRSWLTTASWHEQVGGERSDRNGQHHTAWRQLLGSLVALAVLAAALPTPSTLIAGVRAGVGGGSSPIYDAAQTAVLLAAAVVVWGLLVWGLAIAAIAALGRLPGAGGRRARNVLRRIAPAAAGRLLIAAVGVTTIAGVAGCAVPVTQDGSAAAVTQAAAATAASSDGAPNITAVRHRLA